MDGAVEWLVMEARMAEPVEKFLVWLARLAAIFVRLIKKEGLTAARAEWALSEILLAKVLFETCFLIHLGAAQKFYG